MTLNDIIDVGECTFYLVIECFPISQEIIFPLVTPLFTQLIVLTLIVSFSINAWVVLREVFVLLLVVVVLFEWGFVAGLWVVVEIFYSLVVFVVTEVCWRFGNFVKHWELLLKLLYPRFLAVKKVVCSMFIMVAAHIWIRLESSPDLVDHIVPTVAFLTCLKLSIHLL